MESNQIIAEVVSWFIGFGSKIEAGCLGLEKSLVLDSPRRRVKTSYQYPKSEYVVSRVRLVHQAVRSVLLGYRLIEIHLEDQTNEGRTLVHTDIITLSKQQELWQRALSEALVKTVLLSEAENGDEHFRLLLNKEKYDFRRKMRDEQEKLYGSNSRTLDLYIDNERIEIERLQGVVSAESCALWDKKFKVANAETLIARAFPYLNEHEKHSMGHYLSYRIRSSGIHGSTFPNESRRFGNVDELEHHLMTTLFIARDLLVRCARLFPVVLPEIAALTAGDIEKSLNDVLGNSFIDSFSSDFVVGDRVVVTHAGQDEYAGEITAIREGTHGGRSFQIEPDREGWYDRDCFHPAKNVRRE